MIRSSDREDRHSFVCPEGHVGGFVRKNEFHCTKCSNTDVDDPRFDVLRNRLTGETFTRDEIEFRTAAGVYRELIKIDNFTE